MNTPRAVRSSAAILKLLGLDPATTTDSVVLLRSWSSKTERHMVIDVARGGVNRHLLETGDLSARRAVAAACDLSRESGLRVILVVSNCYVLIHAGAVEGVVNPNEGLA